MLYRSEFAQWNGDIIVGGEPEWFQDAVLAGKIVRSCEFVGPCLFVATSRNVCVAMPGDTLHRSVDGELGVLTLDEAIYALQQLTNAEISQEPKSYAA